MKSKLTLTIRESGTIELLNSDGVWFGPELGRFTSKSAARNWANQNGYTVARKTVDLRNPIMVWIGHNGIITVEQRIGRYLHKRKYLGYSRKDAVAEFKAELLEL